MQKNEGIFRSPYFFTWGVVLSCRERGNLRLCLAKPGKHKLFQGDVKAEKSTEIMRSFLLSIMIKSSMAEVDKGFEVPC